MDATPRDNSIEVVETAVCKWCNQGIHRQGGAWQHNTYLTTCFAIPEKNNVTPLKAHG